MFLIFSELRADLLDKGVDAGEVPRVFAASAESAPLHVQGYRLFVMLALDEVYASSKADWDGLIRRAAERREHNQEVRGTLATAEAIERRDADGARGYFWKKPPESTHNQPKYALLSHALWRATNALLYSSLVEGSLAGEADPIDVARARRQTASGARDPPPVRGPLSPMDNETASLRNYTLLRGRSLSTPATTTRHRATESPTRPTSTPTFRTACTTPSISSSSTSKSCPCAACAPRARACSASDLEVPGGARGVARLAFDRALHAALAKENAAAAEAGRRLHTRLSGAPTRFFSRSGCD